MDNLEKNWYVVNTYASHENKVKDNIVRRIESMNMQDYIFRVVVAEYEEPVKKDGVIVPNKFKTKNMYPGYIFIEMIMTDEAWYVVRNTPGVTGFIGSSGKGAKPFPVSTSEIESVLKRVGLSENNSTIGYKVGEIIRVVNGPFAETISPIEEIDEEKNLITVKTIIFGREQDIHLSASDIEKYNK